MTSHHSHDSSWTDTEIHSPHGHLGISTYTYVQRVSLVALIPKDQTLDGNDVLGPNQSEGTCQSLAATSKKTHLSFALSSFQAQFRFAAQKLGQLQDKFESQAQVTKGDIATLLRQGNVGLARAKAESVIKDEIHTDLLQVLEMYLGVVLEQFAEIEKKYSIPCYNVAPSHPLATTRLIPSPPLVEAASGIIYAAPVLGIRGMYAFEIHTKRLLIPVCRIADCPRRSYPTAW